MSKALLKFVRVSPTKARLVAREVQGMNAELALAALEFMPNKAAGIISKVIASAVANGEFEPEEVIITSCRVDKAAVMKRWRPRARGTASRIIKPTAHILVEVATVADAEARQAAAGKVAETKRASAKKATEKKESVEKAPTESAAIQTEAKAESSSASATKAPAKKADAKGDDLTKIKGIGKVYQGKLNDEGIFTFEDVVNMTDEQIAMMEEKYTFKGDFSESVADAKNFVNGKEA
jgi:large subunit ribosomal protein L22